jgi:alpha-tubulin suppressor-like RCC1 family protein
MRAIAFTGLLALGLASLISVPATVAHPDNSLVSAVDVAAGYWHSCTVTSEGHALCWGQNIWGQIGDGTKKLRSTPTQVVGLDHKFVDVATGTFHTCALTASGDVQCWGNNSSGQLGDGTTHLRTRPVDVVGLPARVTQISALGHFTCALTARRQVWCWGSNGFHELGDGSDVGRRTHPVQVVGLTRPVTDVSAGVSHSCALLDTGRVQCWGYGLLGDGRHTESATAVMVKGIDDAVDLAAGLVHSCVARSNGTVWCWGSNSFGYLGDGTKRHQPTPVVIPGLAADVTHVSAGWERTCVVTVEQEVQCWGASWTGDGTARARYAPVTVVGTGHDVRQVSAGGAGGCFVTETGAARCWGPGASTGRRSFDDPTVPVTLPEVTGRTARAYQPDLTISSTRDGRYRGDGLYNRTGDHQSRSIHVSPGHRVTTWIRVTNDSDVRDVLLVGSGISSDAHARLQVRAFSGGREVTDALGRNAFWTRLATNSHSTVRMTVRIPRSAHYLDSYRVKISVISAHDSSQTDVVAINVLTLKED